MVNDQIDETNYEDEAVLADAWISGKFRYPKRLYLKGIPYNFKKGSNLDFSEHIVRGKKAYLLYTTSEDYIDISKDQGLNHYLIFIWGTDAQSQIRPFDIRTETKARFNAMVARLTESQFERIGDVALMKVMLPSGVGAIKGKVDTGAEISSLHADEIRVMNGTVRFMNKQLSKNAITVPIAQHQAVKSADGGVEQRPVIELDIEINGKGIRKALFNLNDRNEMEYPCLIGQNILEKTNFLVDPKIDDPQAEVRESEIINDDVIQELIKDVTPRELPVDTKKLDEVYATLQGANVTIGDLIKHARTEARQIIDNSEV